MSISARETAAECIQRACASLTELNVIPTLAGARTADLLAEILQASREQQAAIDALVSELLEAESEIDNQTGNVVSEL